MCMARCEPGYTGTPVHYSCRANGHWAANTPILCTAVDCGALVAPLNGAISGDTSTWFGSQASFSCGDGYEVQSGHTMRRCGQDGAWNGQPAICTAVPCGALPPVPSDLERQAAHQVDGDGNGITTMLYTCVAGYELVSGSSYRHCHASTPTWDGIEAACRPRDCGSTIASLDSSGQATCTGNTVYHGDRCFASCQPGFSGRIAEYVCGGDGHWVASPQLRCVRKYCGSIVAGLDVHGVADCRGESHYGGDDCEAACALGYSGAPVTYTCGVDGLWVVKPPAIAPLSCSPIDCGATIQGLPSSASASCGGNTRRGGTACIASCSESGYVGIPAVYYCGGNGLCGSLGQ